VANKKPSQRYSTHKLGSLTGSSAITTDDYFIVQDASEVVADDQVRVTTGADLIFDLDTVMV
jgi:UDP-N-acetyl-D-mannosaminuronate dehydrogenase